MLAQELFERADPAFVAEIVRCGGRKKLRRFAIRWSEARGAFARESRIALADRNIDRGDARVLVKVLPGDRVLVELSPFDPSRGRINGKVV